MRQLLVAFAFVALGSCSRCAPAPVVLDAGVDAGVTVARPQRAQPPAKVCGSFTACADACSGGDAGAQCYEAALFTLEGVDGGRDLAAVTRFAGLACDQGDGRGCMRAGRGDDALAVLPRQCDDGSSEACELLVPLLKGAAAEARAAQAVKLLEAACEKPEPFACARLGSAKLNGRLGAADVKGGLALLERACTHGVAGACIELAMEYSRGRPPDLDRDAPKALEFGRKAKALSQ